MNARDPRCGTVIDLIRNDPSMSGFRINNNHQKVQKMIDLFPVTKQKHVDVKQNP